MELEGDEGVVLLEVVSCVVWSGVAVELGDGGRVVLVSNLFIQSHEFSYDVHKD